MNLAISNLNLAISNLNSVVSNSSLANSKLDSVVSISTLANSKLNPTVSNLSLVVSNLNLVNIASIHALGLRDYHCSPYCLPPGILSNKNKQVAAGVLETLASHLVIKFI